MGKNTPQQNPAKECTCNKCGLKVGSAIPEKKHRNCGGSEGAKPRPAHDRLPGAERGEWR